MTRITNFAALWISGAVIALYFLLYAVLGQQQSKFVADLLVLAGASFMAASMWPATGRAIRRGANTGPDRFIISFWLIWTFVLAQRIWLVVFALYDRPVEWQQSPISGFIAIMIAIAAGYGAAAPLTGPEELPSREKWIMTAAGLVSGVVLGIAIGVYIVAGSLP